MAFGLAIQSFSVSARVYLGNPEVNSDGTETTVVCPIISAQTGESVLLVASYVDEVTGKLLSINSTYMNDASAESEIEVKLPDKSAENAKLHYYLLRDRTTLTPIENFAPVAPKAGGIKLDKNNVYEHWRNKLTLDWSKSPADDYDSPADMLYNLYDEGSLLAENIEECSVQLDNLLPGNVYHLAIAAKDKEGAVSKESQYDTITVDMPNTAITAVSSDCWLDHATIDGQVGHNLIYAGVADDGSTHNRAVLNEAGGMPCFVARTFTRPSGSIEPGFLAYRFSEAALKAYKDETEFTYEIIFYDNDISSVLFHSNYIEGASLSAVDSISMIGDNAWKVGRGSFTTNGSNLALVRDGNKGGTANFYHFRFQNSAAGASVFGHELNAFSLTCMPTSEFEKYASLRGADLTIIEHKEKNENNVENVTAAATVICGLESNAKGLSMQSGDVNTIANRSAFNLDNLSGRELTFKITDNSLLGQAGEVTVCCYAERETTVTLGGETKVIPANTWRKLTFSQSSINSEEYGISANNTLYVSSLRVTASR